ncbi:MAG: FUSC family protein [Humidesulfovibrio sp.]|nr:FUSC family protein [Humidesulfovibrio sp.]
MTIALRLSKLIPASQLRHAVRTALAATVTALLTQVLHLEQGYWAVFSTILVMQTNFGSSIAASWARLLGTGAGAFLGALMATAVDALLGQGMPTLATAMFITIFFCALLAAKNDNLRLAGLTAAIVICLHEGGRNSAFAIGLSRFMEVGLGIVVALAVSLAWPSRARVVLRFGLGKGLEQLADLLAALMDSRMQGRYDRPRVFHRKDAVLRLSMRNRELFGSARLEPGPSGQGETLNALLTMQDRLAEHLLAMDHAIEDAPPEGFHQHLHAELTELGAALGQALRTLATALQDDAIPDAPALKRLETALDQSEMKLLDLRQQRIIAVYDLDEVMHFYSFYHGLRGAARELRAEYARRLNATPAS